MTIKLSSLRKLKQAKEPIAVLTAYDAAFAHWAAEAGVEVLLVGDSLGMVVQGEQTTLPVTLDQMVYHTKIVANGVRSASKQAWLVADLPFMADATLEQALASSAALIKAGADMVKLEGGARVVPMIDALSQLGVPVCGHLGLLPQSVLKKGYRVVGRDEDSAQALLADAKMLEAAGADMLVLECVPTGLAKQISEALEIPVIGIGSGAQTDGQVLVTYDLLGLTVGKTPSFSKNFLAETNSIANAFKLYVSAVKSREFPSSEHELAR